MFFIDIVRRILSNTRTCPKCGDTAYEPTEKRGKMMTCQECGSKIPPPKVRDQD